jgi:hypothetical protein
MPFATKKIVSFKALIQRNPKKSTCIISKPHQLLGCNYNIPKDHKKDMWDISRLAISGSPGIYAHVSFRKDKSDCHPQEESEVLLKAL